jgi:hypothetical protein
MSRRVKLPTLEMGEVTLLVMWEKGGQWEADVEPLRGPRIGDQFGLLSQEALDHALHGFSRPLVDALGIPPAGALRKLPEAAKRCAKRQECPFYLKPHCHPGAKRMPWCFEPGGLSEAGQTAAARIIAEWREGVYVVVVKEP